MKHSFFKILFTLSIIVSSLVIFSQESISEEEKKEIQRHSRFVRKKFTKHPSVLAAKLTKDLDDDASKVIAITYWITKNIKYDFSAYISNAMNRHSSWEVLRRKIALCDEYATLFNDMCESVGIQSETINGYVHEFDFFAGDTLYRAEHAWSTVNVDDKWELMDLTWGAGHLEPKRQLFKNLMWILFEKPYEVEWHYVHAYNPDWFYVNPNQMITSHYPTLDFFQFLDDPLSIEKFNDFSASLSKPLQSTTAELKAYLGMGDLNKLDLENTQTQRINPNNNRLVGFNNYLIFKELHFNNYDENAKEILASEKVIKNMKSVYDKANENLLQSIRNNNLEYMHYNRRSIAWKDSLNHCNNSYIKQVKLRQKLNKKQISSIKKIYKKSTAYAKSTNKSKDRFKRFKLNRTKRPDFDKSKPSLAKNYLLKKDSLICDIFNYSYLTDSLFSEYDKIEQRRMSSSEATVTKIHQKNALLMKKHNLKKMRDYAFIYLDENLVDKPWFPINFSAANNQNLVDLDVLLKDLTQFLPLLKSSVKSDYNNTKYALRAIKSAKKNSFKNLNEKLQADEIIDDYKNRMKEYADSYSDYSQISAKVSLLLKYSQKKLKGTYKSLKKDMALEKQRHKNYMAYRESVRYSENFNMKLLLKDLKGWNKHFQEEDPVLVKKPIQTKRIVENNNGEEVEKLSFTLNTNAVLVVGTHLGSNDRTATEMDKIGEFLKSKGVRVQKFYNHQSDWELIKEASQNAHFFIYSGHGSNMGKNGTGGLVLKDWITNDQIQNELKLKDNALVLFKSVCGGAGSSAGDNGDIGYKEAELRVSDYAEPFLAIGASTYYANNYGDGCVSFLEDFFDGLSIEECYNNSLLWGVNKHISKNYMYQPNLKIAISGSNANSGTHTVIRTDGNGVQTRRQVPNSKSYSISYVGNPYFNIGDIYKKKRSYVMN